MNRIIITGRLTSKPELRYTDSNKAYCKFCLAVRGYQDKADFINCECWDKLAENLCKYQEKGNMICVEGKIKTSSYEVNGEKKYSMDVVCNNIEFLSSKKEQKTESSVPDIDLHSTRNDYLDVDTDPFADFDEQVSIDGDFLE